MATLFDRVYKQYFKLTNDTDIKSKNTNYGYKTLYDYLEYSMSLFGDYCYKNLNDLIPFSEIEYEFVGDGISTEFTLNPVPDANSELFITINNDSSNITYSYDNVNNKITLNSAPTNGADIYVSAYTIGQFNNDLNVQEINLLAEGMTIPFKKNKLNSSLLMNNLVYGKDYSPHSPANHIKEVRTTIESDEESLKQKIMMYMWKQNTNISNILHG